MNMPEKQIRALIFDLCMTVLAGIFFFLSFTFNAKARFVPLMIATPTFAIALWRSIMGLIAWLQARKVKTGAETSITEVSEESTLVGTPEDSGQEAGTPTSEPVMARVGIKAETDLIAELKAQAEEIVHHSQIPTAESGPRWRKELMAVAWILLLLAMVWLIGFIWTIPLYIFLVLRVRSREPWKLSVGISLGAWMFMYALFVYFLKIEFATGLLLGLFL